MSPSHRQVVFEGDSLPFQCMASYIDQDMQVLWYQDGRIVETDESQGIFVEKNMIHNCSLIARYVFWINYLYFFWVNYLWILFILLEL
jgi:G protein-coupled receptor 125